MDTTDTLGASERDIAVEFFHNIILTCTGYMCNITRIINTLYSYYYFVILDAVVISILM